MGTRGEGNLDGEEQEKERRDEKNETEVVGAAVILPDQTIA